jgi:predicted ATPase
MAASLECAVATKKRGQEMRIDRLMLTGFRNLVDFNVDFDETSTRQVIVGRNGVGKSNLLEALTRIFRDLDLEEDSEFGYEIEYLCNRHFVKVQSLQINKEDCKRNPNIPRQFSRQYWIAAEAESSNPSTGGTRPYQQISEADFSRRNRPINQQPNPDRILPLYVFGYYSGVISRFAKIFEKHEERYFREQIAGEEAPLRPLFQAKPNHSQFALLAFYATRDSAAQKFLESEFRIMGFDSVLFSLREPYWHQARPTKNRRSSGDPRFWFAGGKVAPFLDSLFAHCFVPMSGQERIRISIGQEKTKERRYCFLPDQVSLQAIAEGLSNKEFFARLESLVFSDLVDGNGADVRIWIRLKDSKEPATFQDLAEGERQLLTVLGLMRFTAEKEALFLLDEPDTHLNPAWCLDYLDNLRMYGAEPPNSQIIMTTHSPLTFAGMDKNEVVVMERGEDGKIFADHPTSAPKGMGFAAILTSDFFGLRSTLDKETLKKIDVKRELASKTEKTDGDRRKLAELNDELGKLDFSHTVRDPLYEEFIRAITTATKDDPSLQKPAPQSDMWRKRQEIAKDIAKRLLKAGMKS